MGSETAEAGIHGNGGTPQGSPGAIARGPGGAGSPSQRSGLHTGCRPCVAPRPRLRRGTPQEPGAPAVAVHMADPCRTCRPRGATSAPIMLREAARGLPGRRQKRRRDVWTARVMDRPPRGPHPPRAATVPGYVGHVAHRWAIAKTLLWPIEMPRAPRQSDVFDTKYKKSAPRGSRA